MKQVTNNSVVYWTKVIVLGVILGTGLQFAQAWTEPAAAPPGGNVPGPLTVGPEGQQKEGNLILNTNGIAQNGLLVLYGEVGIGTINPRAKLHVNGKIRSTSTQDTDSGDTVVTKNYVDSQSGGMRVLAVGSKENASQFRLKGNKFHNVDVNQNIVIQSKGILHLTGYSSILFEERSSIQSDVRTRILVDGELCSMDENKDNKTFYDDISAQASCIQQLSPGRHKVQIIGDIRSDSTGNWGKHLRTKIQWVVYGE